MSKVKFLPWVGTAYQDGINGKCVLVLGESHYCANEIDAVPTLTQEIIKDLFDSNSPHEGYKNTYTKFAKALVGTDISFEDKERIWNSVAFYNYVQEPISGARVAPTDKQFRDSDEAFFEILEQLQPDYIIAWGQRLYDNLPNVGFLAKSLKVSPEELYEVWCYTVSSGRNIPLLRITHPSAAFSWDVWYNTINKFLKY
ncbi:hypothetical protein [Myroides marinus]|uniref:hypothetical protein n=1 Tax=Myroides marinus TaxID=703342 RepID=UPI0025780326|nr:hypothetical protein [Myroides marinus]MDM1370764.1 hypothetical protein [Myroides marinus]MDM1531832.1 hypothetical protein [Myroides marinus]MDM1538744.1 hypothetical protein [Myroides marinus]